MHTEKTNGQKMETKKCLPHESMSSEFRFRSGRGRPSFRHLGSAWLQMCEGRPVWAMAVVFSCVRIPECVQVCVASTTGSNLTVPKQKKNI